MSEKTKNNLGVTMQSVMLTLGLYFLGRIFRNNLYFPLIASLESSNPGVYEILRYFGHFWFLLFLILYLVLVKEEKPYLNYFEFSKKRKDPLWVVLGLIIGFVMNGFCILVAYLHGDIDMVPAKFNIGLMILMFISVAFQSSVEEFQHRLWTFNRIHDRSELVFAVLGSAIGFGLTHLLNPGISFLALISIIAVGILYAVSYYYTECIWFPCAMHASWNFTQNCIFGLPNSGNPAVMTLMQPTYTKDSVVYDSEFGVEGTIVAVAINVIAIIIVTIIGEKQKRRKKI